MKRKEHWIVESASQQKFNAPFHRGSNKLSYLNLTISKFQVIHDLMEEEQIKMKNSKVTREAIDSICYEVLGSRKHRNKGWITAHSLSRKREHINKWISVNKSRDIQSNMLSMQNQTNEWRRTLELTEMWITWPVQRKGKNEGTIWKNQEAGRKIR